MARPKRLLLASFDLSSTGDTWDDAPEGTALQYARKYLRKRRASEPPAYATIGEGELLVDPVDRW